MIYFDDHIWDFDLQQALAEVTPQRREYALRYRHERDQRLSVAAYNLLWRALRTECGIDELPVFDYSRQGKPMLQGYPNIHFSLSHCHEAVACAVSDHPVGIDIETTEEYNIEVASQVMSDEEQQQIIAEKSPDMAFYRLWTMKESLYKLTGDDNNGDIRHMLDKALPVTFETIVFPHSICTVCRYTAEYEITNK